MYNNRAVKNQSDNARDTGLIPGSGRSPGAGNGSPLQYSCLRNSMYRGTWWATVHGVSKSRTRISNQNNNNRKGEVANEIKLLYDP